MAATPQPAFTVDAALTAAFDSTSAAVALPGTPANDTVVRLVNVSTVVAYVALGTSTVTVTKENGVAIAPGQVPTYLGLPSGATHIAGVTSLSGYAANYTPAALVNVATGN